MDLTGYLQLKKQTKINSPRAEQVQAVCDFMNDNRFAYWLGRTKKLSPDSIYRLLKEAGTGRNPQAFFQFLLKKQTTTSS